MKTLILATVALLFMLAVFAVHAQGPQAPPTTGRSGRFQLVAGEYVYLPKNGSLMTLHAVFKIDTETGEAWRFVSLMDNDDKLVERWQKIER
jgi:hypothetical protein